MEDVKKHGMKERKCKPNEQSIVELAFDFEEKRLKKGEIKANSYVRLVQTINTVGTYKFANIPIQKVTRHQIEVFLQNERVKAEDTLKKEFRLVKRVFALATKKGIIKEEDNFFVGYDPIIRPKSYQKKQKVQALTRKEEFLLTKFIETHPCKYNNIILIALYTRNENWRSVSVKS